MNTAAKKRVLHLPSWRGANPYQNLLGSGIERAGWQCDFANFEKGLLPLRATLARHGKPDVVHLHWIAPLIEPILWSGSALSSWIKLLLLALDVYWLRTRGVRVVWTWHNLVSHESRHARRERRARRVLAACVNRILFHSASARETVQNLYALHLAEKSTIAPHGSYIGVYQQDPQIRETLRRRFRLADDDLVVLYFGTLRAYKGISELLGAFAATNNPRLKLIVAGKPYGEALLHELQGQIDRDPRAHLYPQHVPDQEVAALFSLASVVAIPFQRTLSSGSVILALSLGKALLLSDQARVLDVVDDEGTLFFADSVQLAQMLDTLPNQDLSKMGQHNLDLARDLDWDKIGRIITAVYTANPRNPS